MTLLFPVSNLIRINEFAIRLEAYLAASFVRKGYKQAPPSIELQQGKKYMRVVRREAGCGGGSVHCFIEVSTGDIYKAAGWKTPAKHVRGNILAENYGIGDAVTEYGARYL